MESITYLKNLKIPPKKIRFYLAEIKKMTPVQSLEALYYGRQRGAEILYKAIESAIANATRTLKVDASLLNFKVLTIEEGLVIKRYKPGARGNVRPIKKRMSHIKIILVAKKEKKLSNKLEAQNPNVKANPKSKLKIEKSSAVKTVENKK